MSDALNHPDEEALERDRIDEAGAVHLIVPAPAAYRQVTDLAELPGKTVAPDGARGYHDPHQRDAIAIVFTDGSYLNVMVDVGYERGDEEIVVHYPMRLGDRVALGIATPGEVAEHGQAQARRDALSREQRRQKYEELRAEFERP